MLSSQLGYYSLILGLIFSILILPFSFKNFLDNNIFDKKIYNISFLQFFLVLISFVSLIISFINSDFSNETVYNNSHTTKPLFYKISGTWGNHEGSLLLWLFVLTLFIFLFLITSKNQPKKYRILTILFQQIIIIGFFLFVLITSNPFNYLFPTPKEGLGLNPILQDPALAIHPPILYLGYVGSSIIFSASLSGTIQNYITKEWAKHIKIWVLLSWIFLTLGIMIGSVWAYYELGWGGFWFWDPVENVSLMPWLCLIALLHSILVLEKKISLVSWIVVLSIATFTLSMCGTFLVRSGILNSVHTFANDPSRGIFILIFLFILILISLIVFFVFHKDNQKSERFNFLNKETSILINNLFVMYFLSVVLIGTVYPIFLEVITGEKISVGPPFYNKLIIPFLILFLIIMSIIPNLSWFSFKNRINKIKLIIIFIISLLITFFILNSFGKTNLINTVLIFAAFYLFFITLKDLFIKKFSNFSQKISHFGFSVLILSILLNNFFSTEINTNLRIGEKFNFDNGSIMLQKIETNKVDNYQSIVGFFKVEDKNKKLVSLKPELRIYDQPVTITSEADIKTSLYSDKFLVMNVVKDNEYFNIRYQVKPFMIWIWISTILIAIGGINSLFGRLYEK
ncbi:heme lyase CcmF/NrfE family subunit [Candidatus Pelagibacter sp.]|nr:heme lyase CcmF/NrfE family subunit [Candidatus Pelagibacter sp.]